MKKFFELGNAFLKESDWKDLAMIKLCLCAMGILIGMCVPKKHRELVFSAALGSFIGTYIPLMTKLYGIVEKEQQDEVEIDEE